MSAPPLGACRVCGGSRVSPIFEPHGNYLLRLVKTVPCAECCCERCGEPTDTPPECRDCAERADVSAAKAWREGRQ